MVKTEIDKNTRYLVWKGQPQSVIVRQTPGEGATWNEAVRELQASVRQASVAELPVVEISELNIIPESVLRISVGPGAYAESLGAIPDELQPEEYRISVVGNNLILIGSTADATLWAVADFLDRHLGVRWLWPGRAGRYVPRQESIPIPEMNRIARPALEQRRLRITSQTPQEGEYWLRLYRMGNRTPYTVHGFTDWWSKYGIQHPEYFAMPPEGQKQMIAKRVKLDLGKRAVDEAIVREWREAGAPDVWNVSPNDGTGFCISEACLAMDTPTGQSIDSIWTGQASLTARYVRFWNRLQEQMREINPQVRLCSLAYSAYRESPLPELRLNYEMDIGFVHSFWAYEAWRGWIDAGARLVLRPNWWHTGAAAPYLPLHAQGEFFKYAYENGMIGFDFDTLIGHWGTQGPLYYLIARLSVRPDLSVDEVLMEYTSAFGRAEPAIRDYLKFWEQFAEEAAYPVNAGGYLYPKKDGTYERLAREHKLPNSAIPGSYEVLPYLYTDDLLERAQEILRRAEQLAAEDDGEVRARIAFLRDGLRHLVLTREVVRYGYERSRPADATVEQFNLLSEQLRALRKELSTRGVVWGEALNFYENKRSIRTETSRTAGWDRLGASPTEGDDTDKELKGM